MPGANTNTADQRTQNDAMFIFEALFHVTAPVVINVAEIAAQRNAKANSIAKRFSEMKKRHPGLNIQTTTVANPGHRNGHQPSPTATKKVGPTTAPKKATTGTKNTASRNGNGVTGKAKQGNTVKEEEVDESDVNVKVEQGTDDESEGGDEDNEEDGEGTDVHLGH